MKTGEAKVKDNVKAYLNEIGAYHFWPVQMGYGKRGLDCYSCIKGQFIVIETKEPKTDDGKAFQRRIMEDIRKAGGRAWLVNDVEVLKQLVEYTL